MVPLSTELVVRDDHHCVLGAAAVIYRAQQCNQMIAAACLTRIARVLVFRCDGLYEADRIQFAFRAGAVNKTQELLFVAQVRTP